MALAAAASLAVLFASGYEVITQDRASSELFNSGILGILLFGVAIITQFLTRRIEESDREAKHQADEAANIQKMAEMIVEKMQTGLVVLSPKEDIILINEAAKHLLHLPNSPTRKTALRELTAPQELLDHYRRWKESSDYRVPQLKPINSDQDLRLSFASLAKREDISSANNTLVFIQDNRVIQREVQQLKLASLGRLTAGIAHEIRNPLGAISHANQLLAESDDMQSGDLKMINIIDRHCKRVNQIIENVLSLSRRRGSIPERIELNQWLENYKNDFSNSQKEPDEIELVIPEQPLFSNIDTSHLEQVLTNLIDNGLRYSEKKIGRRKVSVRLSTDKKQIPIIEVVDYGSGVPKDSRANLFEPFYTTESSGSGLGLYLSRELCEANHASLTYYVSQSNESTFRISLPHADRVL